MTRKLVLALLVSTAIATVSAAEDATDSPVVPSTMEEIENAYRAQDFAAVRAGLKMLAETEPTGNVAYRYARILLDERSGPVDPQEAAEWLSKAVEAEYAPAHTLLARLLLSGGEVPRDAERAARLLQDGATRGEQEAQYYLALLSLAGDGVEQNERDAFVWFRAAAEQGHVESAYELSRLYSRGIGTEMDTQKALDWLRRAASDGHVPAQFFLANALESGQGAKQDRNEALDWFRKAAEGGHPLAMRIVGTKYLQGEGVYQDTDAAIEWLTKAADAGEPGALFNLGLMYGTGEQVERDDVLAFAYIERAAATNLPRAIAMQAAFLELGRGTDADLPRAVALYQKAADAGHDPSKDALKRLALSGALDDEMAPHDLVPLVAEVAEAGDETAIAWLEKQTESGVTPAAIALGALLLGDPVRASEGLAYLKAPARQGQAHAQFLLGEALSTGSGVSQDLEAAHMWFNLAASRGHKSAAESRDVLTDLMTPEQIDAAQAAARAFVEEAPTGRSKP
ncbi:hypothetical protein BXY66_3569 [Shimia isoporae]|uniref:TPR repeat protein n=1 Tax=Shimia isoporae TaxID=647720 RepID=A0A4R1N5S5_9RHOB|nr:tetratricopeptide repeat protein [Shimia isoporae]TCK99865.1 hypothetical protein BXY66_3569 [Shimia isoporae]